MTGDIEGPLVDAFVDRAEHELGEISQQQLDEGWQSLRRAKAAAAPIWPVRLRRRLRPFPCMLGFAVAGAAVLAAVLGYQTLSAQPLGYTLEGLVTRRGDVIEASPDAESRLLFSDESRIVLDGAARLAVGELDARGARIGLLDGAVDVFVKPRANSSWLFSAGPFLVRVKGTSFRLDFAASQGRLRLQMTSGQVEVFAPPVRTVTVGAGESLELFATPPSPTGARMPLAAAPPPEDATSAPETRAAPAPSRIAASWPRRRAAVSLSAGERLSSPARNPALVPTEPSLAWTQWLRQGKYAQVVADAEQRGIDRIIAKARPADMTALADAARYIKRYSLSRQVLLAMRSRFTATESANDASFFLGRLAEATSGSAPALAWYDMYLRDAPRGLYAKEAMGREMRLRGSSPSEATRRIARQYLERFPQGPEADLARALVRADPE